MSSKNSSGKTVSDAQSTTNNDDSGRGAIYGEASEERAARMHERDVVQYPEAEREQDIDTSIDGVPGREIAQKRAEQGRLDRGTDDAVDGSWGGPGGETEFGDKTLYTQERIEGREAELEKISDRAGANPDVHPRAEEGKARRKRQMGIHQDRMEACKAEVEAEAASGTTSRGYVDDPREHVAQETMAEIAEQSGRLAERFGRTRRVVAKRLAEKVTEGADVSGAVMDLVEELVEDRTVVSPISMVEATDSWATVEGVVARLFEPASRNQQQVAVIEDGSSDAKLTIWRNSNQDVRLNEGDVVRVVDGKPGMFNGQVTVAATSDTQVWIREKGDGRSVGNFGFGANGGQSQERRKGSSPSMSSEPVPRPAADRVNHRVRWFFQDSVVPEDYDEQENVERFESDNGEIAAFMATSEERFNAHGVSWGEQKRKEAEEEGRKRRVAERKYNVPDWKKTTSVINSYRHQDMSAFGADQRMVELELPPLRNCE